MITYVIIFVLCMAVSAFFSSSETAFTSASSIRLNAEKKKGNSGANTALSLMQRFDNLLSTILIGNNFVNILASSVATLFFVELWPRYGATLSTIITTVLLLLFGEITPKLLARLSPEKVATSLSPILNFVMLIFKPFVWLFSQWQKLVMTFVNVEETEGISEEELKVYVDEARRSGDIDTSEHQLVHAAIEFDDIRVSSILKPRVDIVAFDVNKDSDEDIDELFNTYPYSKIVAYEKSLDNIIGMLDVYDFHRYMHSDNLTDYSINNILQPVLFVPPVVNLADLLTKMQTSRIHLAIIVDEYGGTLGLVTLEDILEVLVGDIWDEEDNEESLINEQADGSYVIDGRFPLNNFFELIESDDQNNYLSKTLAGFIVEKSKRVPSQGQSFDYQGYQITVDEASDNVINKVSLEKLPTENQEV